EGVADSDHLVARAQPEAGEDRHQGGRPVAEGDRVAHATELRPSSLELGDLATLRDHARCEDLGDRVGLFLAEIGLRDRDHAGAPWCVTATRSWSVSTSGR